MTITVDVFQRIWKEAVVAYWRLHIEVAGLMQTITSCQV